MTHPCLWRCFVFRGPEMSPWRPSRFRHRRPISTLASHSQSATVISPWNFVEVAYVFAQMRRRWDPDSMRQEYAQQVPCPGNILCWLQPAADSYNSRRHWRSQFETRLFLFIRSLVSLAGANVPRSRHLPPFMGYKCLPLGRWCLANKQAARSHLF
jgi:hypothetical protein